MSRIHRFLAMTRAQQSLLAKAFLLVTSIRVALWVLRFRLLAPLLARFTSNPVGGGLADEATVERTVWAVTAIARYVPRATCLTQALATQVLLARQGEASELQIGVARDESLGVRAHAWLEHRGRIVIGGASADDFVPLSSLHDRGSPATECASTAR